MYGTDGIYVLKTAGPEYRAAYCKNIDSIYGTVSDDTGKWNGNPNAMFEFFCDAPVFSREGDAFGYGARLMDKYDFLDDGICVIKDFEDWDFKNELFDKLNTKNQKRAKQIEKEEKAAAKALLEKEKQDRLEEAEKEKAAEIKKKKKAAPEKKKKEKNDDNSGQHLPFSEE
jgi:hypothetical protein